MALHGDNQLGSKRLESLWARGKEFLGTEYAIMGGAMTWVSDRHLVSAISNAGGFGVIACGGMTPELLDEEIKGTQALANKPFGVNLITMHPDLDQLVDVCLANSVSHIVLAGGLPPGGLPAAVALSHALGSPQEDRFNRMDASFGKIVEPRPW